MAYEFVSSALCLQLPHHEKPIQRGGSWQEMEDISEVRSPLLEKKSELMTMDLDSPVNLLRVSMREQLLGFNEYLA